MEAGFLFCSCLLCLGLCAHRPASLHSGKVIKVKAKRCAVNVHNFSSYALIGGKITHSPRNTKQIAGFFLRQAHSPACFSACARARLAGSGRTFSPRLSGLCRRHRHCPACALTLCGNKSRRKYVPPILKCKAHSLKSKAPILKSKARSLEPSHAVFRGTCYSHPAPADCVLWDSCLCASISLAASRFRDYLRRVFPRFRGFMTQRQRAGSSPGPLRLLCLVCGVPTTGLPLPRRCRRFADTTPCIRAGGRRTGW